MLIEDRSVFALVSSLADLERACRELAGLLSALRQDPHTGTLDLPAVSRLLPESSPRRAAPH